MKKKKSIWKNLISFFHYFIDKKKTKKWRRWELPVEMLMKKKGEKNEMKISWVSEVSKE